MKVTGTTYWNSPNTGATNEIGFSALPGGSRNNAGNFTTISIIAFFWTATDYFSNLAWGRYLFLDDGSVLRNSNFKSVGASVRCLKN